MRHPSQNFIKYLMTTTHPQAQKDEWIQMMLASLGYPSPEADYLLQLRADVLSKLPSDFQPSNRYHRASMQFLKNESIHGLHHPNGETREANTIVTNLRIRPIIENLLLGRIETKDIAKKVNSRFGEFFTGGGIDAYRTYYWQVNLLKVEDWAKLLGENEAQRQNTLAIAQVGASMALHKTGFQQQIDSKSMLRHMQEAIFFDFQEWKTKPHGLDRSKAFAGLAKAAVMVESQLSQADSAMKDSLKAFEQFRMETAKQAIPGMREIAPAGNFSGSGAKILDVPVTEEETK